MSADDGMTQADAEAWAAEHDFGPTPEIGLCVGILHGEVFGPYRTPREADAALNRKRAELAAAGTPILPGDDAGSVVFVDPAYHVPATEGSLNG